MKIKIGKSFNFIIVVVCLLAVGMPASGVSASAFLPEHPQQTGVLNATAYPLNPQDMAVVKALDYLRQAQKPEGYIGGFNVSGWAAIALESAGEDPHTWNKGGDSIVDYLQKKTSANFPSEKATDYERMLMAIVAAGENPRNFGGLDYVSALLSLYDGTQMGYATTLNDDSWGILALTAIGESLEIVQNLKKYLLAHQNADGGWGLTVGGASDADNTGAAISALIAAGASPSSQPIIDGLNFLKTQQQVNGGFASIWGGSNTGSTTWAVNAIRAAGQNPAGEEWSQSGNTPVSYLLSQQGTDGSFMWTPGQKSNPEWMTAYAIVSLLGASSPRDNLPPVLSNPNPSPAAIVTSSNPVISAQFTDTVSGVNQVMVRIMLNGNDVIEQAVVTASGISYNATGLGAGTHTVRITVADKCGNEALEEWSFQVAPVDGGGGWSPSASSQQLQAGTTSVSDKIRNDGVFTSRAVAFSEDSKCQLAVAENTRGLTAGGGLLSCLTVVPAVTEPVPPRNSKVVGRVYDVGPDGTTFDQPVTITLYYNDSQIPEGVGEKSLTIFFRSRQTGEWTKLASTVDTLANTVTAEVNHFTEFAILASNRPASIVVSDYSISPTKIRVKESASVSVRVANEGDLTGSREVTLVVDGMMVETKRFTLAGGESQTVNFSLQGYMAGTYTVSIGGISGTFEVEKTPSPARFSLDSLTISPREVYSGEAVNIDVDVSNDGDLSGSYRVTLRVSGCDDETREVAVNGGSTETVRFTVTGDYAGSHVVNINDDLYGTFVVREKASASVSAVSESRNLPIELSPAQTEPESAEQPAQQAGKSVNWLFVISLVVGLILGIAIPVYFILRGKGDKKK